MSSIDVSFKPSLFMTTMMDNSNWFGFENYLEELNYRIMIMYVDGLIRYFPFYTHSLVYQDNELLLDATGNLDADL